MSALQLNHPLCPRIINSRLPFCAMDLCSAVNVQEKADAPIFIFILVYKLFSHITQELLAICKTCLRPDLVRNPKKDQMNRNLGIQGPIPNVWLGKA